LRRETQKLARHIDARSPADGQRVASVVSASNRNAGREQRIGQTMFHRGDAEDRLANRCLRKTDAELSAERRRPGATRKHHSPGLDDAGFGDDAADAPTLQFDATGRARLDDTAA